ncbi:hypothetical protein [Anabaena sp. CCY 9910]|uniref:hypothetical protein n=1 Tax=Anabaena sp. CCY 9910 TaxID=3103870 RepID=UPI0039DF31FE
MSANLWNNSCYWSISPSSTKEELADVTIRFICFKREKEVKFNFCKSPAQAVEVFKRLPNNEKLFDEIKSTCHAVLKLWCFAVKHLEKTTTRLNSSVKTELEFVSHNSSQTANPLRLTPALKTRGVAKC